MSQPAGSSTSSATSSSTVSTSSSQTLLYKATVGLVNVYAKCNSSVQFDVRPVARRFLTQPNEGIYNQGHDNIDHDYILIVNDVIGELREREKIPKLDQEKELENLSHDNTLYNENYQGFTILEILGHGTFGQVVRCRGLGNGMILAIKVIKNKYAYLVQSEWEVKILEHLKRNYKPAQLSTIVNLIDSFIFRKHLCLVFELLSINLYELLKFNQFRGLSTNLIKVFASQILDALIILQDAGVIHCDLKPENILLKDVDSTALKVIDFGSACFEGETVHTYIQSRFYRAPEVLLGLPYTSSIDMWSFGCICAELFIGLPLFPGSSEYNQISRITEMLGTPPTYMIQNGRSGLRYFNQHQSTFSFKPLEQFIKEHELDEKPSKRYFELCDLPTLIYNYPARKQGLSSNELTKEMQNREIFIDFLQGILRVDPFERWSPKQAKAHPFISGNASYPFRPYVPVIDIPNKTKVKAAMSKLNVTFPLSKEERDHFQQFNSPPQHLYQHYQIQSSQQQQQQPQSQPFQTFYQTPHQFQQLPQSQQSHGPITHQFPQKSLPQQNRNNQSNQGLITNIFTPPNLNIFPNSFPSTSTSTSTSTTTSSPTLTSTLTSNSNSNINTNTNTNKNKNKTTNTNFQARPRPQLNLQQLHKSNQTSNMNQSPKSQTHQSNSYMKQSPQNDSKGQINSTRQFSNQQNFTSFGSPHQQIQPLNQGSQPQGNTHTMFQYSLFPSDPKTRPQPQSQSQYQSHSRQMNNVFPQEQNYQYGYSPTNPSLFPPGLGSFSLGSSPTNSVLAKKFVNSPKTDSFSDQDQQMFSSQVSISKRKEQDDSIEISTPAYWDPYYDEPEDKQNFP